jgi:predicted hydrocarbon binding protein
MMRRDEFIRTACLGACSCVGLGLWSEESGHAQSSGSSEVDELKGKLDFVRKRFAKLVAILDSNLDESTRKRVFESLGRACAREFMDLTGKFKGNPRAFLEEIKKRWVEEAEYDEQAGRIRVVDKSKTCTCALVNEQLTPPAFCDCTLGWQMETYSMILGKPVEAELEESILRGGKRCIFRIQVVEEA